MKEKINGVLVALDNEDRSTKKHLLVQIKRFKICLIIKNNNIIFVYFIFIFEWNWREKELHQEEAGCIHREKKKKKKRR